MLLRRGQTDGGDAPRAKRARRAAEGGATLEEAVFGHGAGLGALGLSRDTLGVCWQRSGMERTCHFF